MRVAVLDLGTNSTRALVADVVDGRVDELERLLTITRLGEGVDGARRLAPQAMARVASCVGGYRRRARELGAERVLAVATSAVRDSANGREFLDELAREHELEARVLTGEEEAALTFRGVSAGAGQPAETAVLDVGGGSTELVLGGADGGVRFRTSLDVGCVRLSERFLHTDPPGAAELEATAAQVRELLARDAAPIRGAARLVGVAGTVTTLATIHLGLTSENEAVHGHVLPLAWIEAECERLASLPLEARQTTVGLHPDRAPVIVAGAICVREAVRHAGLERLEVSLCDILHGAALALADGTLP